MLGVVGGLPRLPKVELCDTPTRNFGSQTHGQFKKSTEKGSEPTTESAPNSKPPGARCLCFLTLAHSSRCHVEGKQLWETHGQGQEWLS